LRTKTWASRRNICKLNFDMYQEKLFFGSSHTWALDLLKDRERTILDVGAGSGFIKKHLPYKTVDEVEPGTVYSSLNDVPDKHYDTLLFLDVLEHMPDPESVLLDSVKRFSPNEILISVPNITHWSIRLSILFGFFEYQDRGILDRSHLQFFSIKRAKALINLLSNYSGSLSGSIVPLELILPKNTPTFGRLRKCFSDTLPSLFAYQYLIHIKLGKGNVRT